MSILWKKSALKLLSTLVLTIFLLTACTKTQEKLDLQSEEEKIPKELRTMQEKNEEIIEELEKIVEEMEKPEEPKKPEEKEQSQQSQSSQQSEGGETSEGSEGNSSDSDSKNLQEQQKTSEKAGGQDEETKTIEEKIDNMWNDLKKISEEIHNSWGDYEILALENAISNQELSKFEETINKLTVAIDEKKIEEALVYSNDITYDMSPFFDSYKGNHEGELMRLRYFIRQVLLYGMQGQWNKSEEVITQAEETLSTARAKIKLEKEDQELMEKLGLSITNMKNSIPMKNTELLKIKRDIVLKNIDEVLGKL